MEKRHRRTFSQEFKVEAVRMVTEGGHRLSQVARDLGLDQKLLRRWRDVLVQQGPAEAFPGKGHPNLEGDEVRRLRRELERTREERDILKKALAIFSKPHQP